MIRKPIRAAGGLVTRATDQGPQVVLVHRAKYDDWTLPKGKAEPGEDDLTCALREVEEETGLICEAVRPLGSTEYLDHNGRPKVVRYWVMQAVAGDLGASHEVDDARWLSINDALETISYPHDAELITQFEHDGS